MVKSIGAVVFFLYKTKYNKERHQLLKELNKQKQSYEERISEQKQNYEKTIQDKEEQLEKELNKQKQSYEERIHEQKQNYEKTIQDKEEHLKQIKVEFENITHKILGHFTKELEKSLNCLLNPLEERVSAFEKIVQEISRTRKQLKSVEAIEVKVRQCKPQGYSRAYLSRLPDLDEPTPWTLICFLHLQPERNLKKGFSSGFLNKRKIT